MLYILRQIARTGIRTEPAPAPDEEMIVVARLQRKVLRTLVDALPDAADGSVCAALPDVPAFKLGLGYVEGWRGPVLMALESGPDGTIRRCHPHDPSSLNWPVVEHAVIGNIVPDFPLINKSFNLTYSGQDL